MKRIAKYLFALAALSLAAASCGEKYDPYEVGDAEETGCQGVYFPVQAASGEHIYSPVDDKVLTITVARTNDKEAATVPYEFTSSAEVFQHGDIVFAAGQKETTVDVTFPNIETGVQTDFSMTVTDNKYASKYQEGAISFDASILCVEYKTFGKGTLSVMAPLFSTGAKTVETELQYYEIGNTRYCKLVGGLPSTSAGEGVTADYNFTWNTKTNRLYIPYQALDFYEDGVQAYVCDAIGYYEGRYGADYWSGSTSYSGWEDYCLAQGMLIAKYDGNGGFYLGDWYICDLASAYAGYGYQFGGDSIADCDVFIADGFKRVDYTLKDVTAGLTSASLLPVTVEVGSDVDSVRVAAFEGELTAKQISDQTSAIAAGTVENVACVKEFTEGESSKTATVGLSLEKTGEYTVIAVTYAEGGAQDAGSVTANYVADEDLDAKAVNLTCGIASAEKYPDVNTDTALEIWMYGQDIVDAKAMVFKVSDVQGDYEGCIETLKESESLDDEAIESINEGTYVAVATGLLPGTEYGLLVWASNGYEQDVKFSNGTQKTTGKPLPIYDEYTESSFDTDFYPESSEAFAGKTFNLYAVDLFGTFSTSGIREYVGKVTIADSTTPDAAADDYGNIEEYLNVSGLGAQYAKAYSFTDYDTIEFSLYAGYLYLSSKTTVPLEDGDYFSLRNYSSTYDSFYSGSYLGGFIPVRDGYYAYVDLYYNTYGFRGIAYKYGDYYYGGYYDYLLVDPEKDDNGVAPAAETQVSKELTKAVDAKVIEGRKHMFDKKAVKAGVKGYGSLRLIEDAVCPATSVKISYKYLPTIPSFKNVERTKCSVEIEK